MARVKGMRNRISLLLLSLGIICIISFVIYCFNNPNVVVSSPKIVNWTKHKVVVFESDDWGWCHRCPDMNSFYALSSTDFMKESGEAYSLLWGKYTLESPEDLERLFKILEKYRGGDGRYPIFQANYIMSSPDYEAIMTNGYETFQEIVIPDVPSRWQRGDFIAKAKEGIKRGVWYPEYHGNTHFNTKEWMKLIKRKDKSTLQSFIFQTPANGDREDDCEYDPTLSFKEQKASITTGIERFYNVFGYYPYSSIAPKYIFQTKTERALSQNKIRVIQAKNYQLLQQRSLFDMIRGKIINFLVKKSTDKPWQISVGDYNPKLKLRYLLRNVNLEPGGREDRETLHGANEAYNEIISAWQRNEPAIVNTHRLNYVYPENKWAEEGFKQLDWLLNKIQTEHPTAVYLTDWEVAQLYEDGTSVLYFGDTIICRNFTSCEQTFQIKIPRNKQVIYIKNLTNEERLPFDLNGDTVLFNASGGSYIVQVE